MNVVVLWIFSCTDRTSQALPGVTAPDHHGRTAPPAQAVDTFEEYFTTPREVVRRWMESCQEFLSDRICFSVSMFLEEVLGAHLRSHPGVFFKFFELNNSLF